MAAILPASVMSYAPSLLVSDDKFVVYSYLAGSVCVAALMAGVMVVGSDL